MIWLSGRVLRLHLPFQLIWSQVHYLAVAACQEGIRDQVLSAGTPSSCVCLSVGSWTRGVLRRMLSQLLFVI